MQGGEGVGGGGVGGGRGGRISSNTMTESARGFRQSMEVTGLGATTTTTTTDIAADVESQGTTDNSTSSPSSFIQLYPSCLKPTTSWSIYQILWVLIQSVVGSAVVFGINFGFTLLATKGKEVTLFDFPIPMAGAFFIVILFTTLGGWFVSGSLMSLDSLHGRITPIDPKVLGKLWPSRESSWWWKYSQISEFVAPTLSEMSVNLISSSNSSSYVNVGNSSSSSSSNNESDRRSNGCGSSGLCAPPESPWSFQKLIRRTLDNILIAMPWILFSLLTLFPILIIISFAVFGNHGMHHLGNSQPAFMAAFAGLFANIIFQPVCAIMCLANIGERYNAAMI
jgi:hypothetical protein